jgi:hypothetical protein
MTDSLATFCIAVPICAGDIGQCWPGIYEGMHFGYCSVYVLCVFMVELEHDATVVAGRLGLLL